MSLNRIVRKQIPDRMGRSGIYGEQINMFTDTHIDRKPTKDKHNRTNGFGIAPTIRRAKKPIQNLSPSEGRLVIGPEMASEFLEQYNYADQRRVSDIHVSRLAVQMTEGVWTPGSQISFGVLPNGEAHLINGQHRLHAVIQSGRNVEFTVTLVQVENYEELHKEYYRFDTVIRPRPDNIVVRTSGIADAHGLPKSVAVAAFRAGVIIKQNLSVVQGQLKSPVLGTPDGKFEAIAPWWDFVAKYNELIKDAPGAIKKRLLIPSVMAVALVTLRYQEKLAEQFWSGIAQDDGLNRGDPRKAMVQVLLRGDFRSNMQAGLLYSGICWDKWFTRSRIEQLKITSSTECRPLGTPYAPKFKR